jgi:hypothetical protein
VRLRRLGRRSTELDCRAEIKLAQTVPGLLAITSIEGVFSEIWLIGSSIGVENTVALKQAPGEMLTTNGFMIAFFFQYPISLFYEWSFI